MVIIRAFRPLRRTSTFLTGAALLAACSGGGGSPPATTSSTPGASSITLPSPTPSPKTTPSPTPTSTQVAQAVVTGRVVANAADSGLAGVTVAIAPDHSPGSSYTTVATSGADGTFGFTTTPGTYVIAVGSNSPTAFTYATAHDEITLVAGPNAIGEPVPHAVPEVTLTAAQTSGNFRLTMLHANETRCVTGMNAGRTTLGLKPLVVDEEDLEVAEATLFEEVAQNTDQPTPLFNGYQQFLTPTGDVGGTSSMGFATCAAWTGTYSDTSGNPPYPFVSNPAVTWYGASFGGAPTYGLQDFSIDPSTTAAGTQASRRFHAHSGI